MSNEPQKTAVEIDTATNTTGVDADVTVLPGVKGEIKFDSKDAAEVFNRAIDKVCAAIGMIYEPTHRVRMTKADAKVLAIRTEALENLTPQQENAVQRFLFTETRKQENLENILDKAAEQITADAKPEDVDEDFILDWAERASKVSDDDMQTLWARLLSGEMNSPGSFRKSALHTVSMLETEDANYFADLSRFAIDVGEPLPYISESDAEIYIRHNIYFDVLSHLESIGLIYFDSVDGFQLNDWPRSVVIKYGSMPLSIKMPEGVSSLPVGKARFTRVGKQLFPLTNAHMITELPQHFADTLAKEKISVTGPSIEPSQPAEQNSS